MTPITPIKAPALADLRNALQLAVTYGDKDIADSDAKQALDRIRGLIACALAKLGEPNEAALQAAWAMGARSHIPVATAVEWDTLFEHSPDGERMRREWERREARDAAAVILRAALTGEVGGEGFIKSLPCPTCDGSGMVAGGVCIPCKGTGIPW